MYLNAKKNKRKKTRNSPTPPNQKETVASKATVSLVKNTTQLPAAHQK